MEIVIALVVVWWAYNHFAGYAHRNIVVLKYKINP